MKLSLDYDDTFTRDPETWYKVAMLLQQAGHTIYGFTMRTLQETRDIDPRYLQACNGGMWPTAREAKEKFAKRNSIHIDVWIDDSPIWILTDAR